MTPITLNESNVNELHQFITNKLGIRIYHEDKYILEFSINKIWFDNTLKTPKLKINIELFKHLLKINIGHNHPYYKLVNISSNDDIKNNDINTKVKYIVYSSLSDIIFDFCNIPKNKNELDTYFNQSQNTPIILPNFTINKIIWNLEEQPNIIKI